MDSPQRVILDKPSIIKQLGLFSELALSQIDLVVKVSEFYEYKKDEVIYNEADPPDAFYYLISGRIRVFTKDKSGNQTTLEYLHRGSYFGIISLLTGETHSATVQVLNDAIVLKVLKDDFHSVLKEIPQLAIHLSSTLSRRLKRKALGQKTVFESTIISIYGMHPGLGCSLYAFNLAKALWKETKKEVILLDMARLDEEGVVKILSIKENLTPLELMPVFFDEVKIKNSILKHESGVNILRIPCEPSREPNKAQITPLLSYLTNIFEYCIVNLTHRIDEDSLAALAQSDLVHIMTDNQKENVESTNNFIKELETILRYPQEKVRVIVDEINGKLENRDILKHKIYATLVDANANSQDYYRAIRRIAREIGGVLVGLALGSGAAWGLANIGVIKVFEKEGIPVDIVVGSSMGALIGAFWAAGNTGLDMERLAVESKNNLFSLRDLKFPIRGLISDEKTMSFLRRHLGRKTFQDIRFPLKIVATEIERRKAVIIDSGPLVEAVRASISIPGVYSPVKYQGKYLIDGGIMDPIPISVLLRMKARKIIAINTLPSPEDIEKSLFIANERLLKEEQEIKNKNFPNRIIAKLKIRIIKFFKPNILDIITSSIEALEYSTAEASCRQADIVIHPTLSGCYWQDFLNPEKLIALGEEACLKKLPEIKKLIEE